MSQDQGAIVMNIHLSTQSQASALVLVVGQPTYESEGTQELPLVIRLSGPP